MLVRSYNEFKRTPSSGLLRKFKLKLFEKLLGHLLAALRGKARGFNRQQDPSGGDVQPQRDGDDVTRASTIVTALEVSEVHGTGVLLQRVFKNDSNFIHIGCANGYNSQSSGALRLCIPAGIDPSLALPVLLGASSISRILVVPWLQQDIHNALAAKALSSGKLCAWIMDHNPGDKLGNVSEGNMRQLVNEADLLLAISPALADYYTATYGRQFHFAPPIVDRKAALTETALRPPPPTNAKRGVLVGNIWSAVWLRHLFFVLEQVKLDLETFGSGSPPHVDAARLDKFVRKRGHVPEAELIASMRNAAYALVPGGTMDEHDDLPFISRFSIPSRVLFLSAIGNLPIVYLGSPDTAAAKFIETYGLGVVCPYRPEAVEEAVAYICEHDQQTLFRNAAVRAAALFSIDDMGDWIWRSVELGRPIDARWAHPSTTNSEHAFEN